MQARQLKAKDINGLSGMLVVTSVALTVEKSNQSIVFEVTKFLRCQPRLYPMKK
jgi:hypothetical protein